METASLYPRNISPRIDEALRDSKTASRYIGVLKQTYLLRRIEVKAAATVRATDLRGLKKLASLAGEQFRCGVLLYDGTETLPLGDNLWAAPLSALWGR